MKIKIKLTLIILLAAAFLAGCSAQPEAIRVTHNPENAPQSEQVQTLPSEQPPRQAQSEENGGEKIMLGDFTALTIDGAEFTEKDISDKDLTIINFWTTTCPPCINEMPDLAEYRQKLADEGSNIQLITYCLDGAAYPDTAKAILDKSGFDGATLIASDGVMGDLANSVMYTPTNVFILGDGEAAGSIIGAQPNIGEVYTQAAEALLSESA